MKKRLIEFLILVPVLIMSGITLTEANKKSPLEVIGSIRDEVGLFSVQIGQTDPAITIAWIIPKVNKRKNIEFIYSKMIL